MTYHDDGEEGPPVMTTYWCLLRCPDQRETVFDEAAISATVIISNVRHVYTYFLSRQGVPSTRYGAIAS